MPTPSGNLPTPGFTAAHKATFAGRMTRLRAFMLPRYFVNK
jgi:hypothetical protein